MRLIGGNGNVILRVAEVEIHNVSARREHLKASER